MKFVLTIASSQSADVSINKNIEGSNVMKAIVERYPNKRSVRYLTSRLNCIQTGLPSEERRRLQSIYRLVHDAVAHQSYDELEQLAELLKLSHINFSVISRVALKQALDKCRGRQLLTVAVLIEDQGAQSAMLYLLGVEHATYAPYYLLTRFGLDVKPLIN